MTHDLTTHHHGGNATEETKAMEPHEKTHEDRSTLKEEILMHAIEDLEEALIELEEYAKLDKVPPKNRRYLIRIDKTKYEVHVAEMTGRQLLELAGKRPPENFLLTQKFRGGATKKIDLGDEVDFTTPGVERFMTLPLDQQEG